MRSIVVSSSPVTSTLSEPTSETASSSMRRDIASAVVPSASASSSLRRAAAVQADEALAGLGDVALPAAQRARRPVVAAQLVEHRAVDPGPRELLERGALVGVVAVDRADQRLEAAGDEVLDLAAGRDLADLLVDDVLDHRREREHQAVAHPPVTGRVVLPPQLQRSLGGDALRRGFSRSLDRRSVFEGESNGGRYRRWSGQSATEAGGARTSVQPPCRAACGGRQVGVARGCSGRCAPILADRAQAAPGLPMTRPPSFRASLDGSSPHWIHAATRRSAGARRPRRARRRALGAGDCRGYRELFARAGRARGRARVLPRAQAAARAGLGAAGVRRPPGPRRSSCSSRARPSRCSRRSPREPVLLNYAGVALYELWSLGARAGAVRGGAAPRSLARRTCGRNLEQVARRRRSAPPAGGRSMPRWRRSRARAAAWPAGLRRPPACGSACA